MPKQDGGDAYVVTRRCPGGVQVVPGGVRGGVVSALRALGRELPPSAVSIPCGRGYYPPTTDRYRPDAAHVCPSHAAAPVFIKCQTVPPDIRVLYLKTSGAIWIHIDHIFHFPKGYLVTAVPEFKNVDPFPLEMVSSTHLFFIICPPGYGSGAVPPGRGRFRAVGDGSPTTDSSRIDAAHVCVPIPTRQLPCLHTCQTVPHAPAPFGCLALSSGLRVGSCPPLAVAIPCDKGDYSPTMDRYRFDAAHGCPIPHGRSRVCTIVTRPRTIRSSLEPKETSGAICPILLTTYTSQRG